MNKQLGIAIRNARERAKLTQQALAAACGWESQGRVSMYEHGQREPTIEDLALIARATGTSAVELLAYATGEELPATDPRVRSAAVQRMLRGYEMLPEDVQGAVDVLIAALSPPHTTRPFAETRTGVRKRRNPSSSSGSRNPRP